MGEPSNRGRNRGNTALIPPGPAICLRALDTLQTDIHDYSTNMNRAVEQDLTRLLPTLNGPLPTELVQLAVSILAQSKSRASSLRAEEEVARGYACAHIACEKYDLRMIVYSRWNSY